MLQEFDFVLYFNSSHNWLKSVLLPEKHEFFLSRRGNKYHMSSLPVCSFAALPELGSVCTKSQVNLH